MRPYIFVLSMFSLMGCGKPPQPPERLNLTMAPDQYMAMEQDVFVNLLSQQLTATQTAVAKALSQPLPEGSMGLTGVSVEVRLDLGLEAGVVSIDLINGGFETSFHKL